MTLIPLIAYRRVSTAGQVTDGLGLPVQKDRINGYAVPHGYRVVRWESDPGVSGKADIADRPGIIACLKAIQAGEVAGVIFTDLGRLSRLLTIQEAILAQVWRHDGIVVTVESGLVEKDDPDDPMRTAMRQMAGVFYQLERSMIVKRLRNGRAKKAENGGYAYGSPAYGSESVNGVLTPVPAEMQVIARIQDLRSQGMGTPAIASALNEAGTLTRHGKSWAPAQVWRVLDRLDRL